MSLAFPNTVLNTIVAEAIDELADKLEAQVSSGGDLDEALTAVVKDAYGEHRRDLRRRQLRRGVARRGGGARAQEPAQTPDALPEVLADHSVAAFEKYEVLSHRELESRYEVWLEQYTSGRTSRPRRRR